MSVSKGDVRDKQFFLWRRVDLKVSLADRDGGLVTRGRDLDPRGFLTAGPRFLFSFCHRSALALGFVDEGPVNGFGKSARSEPFVGGNCGGEG